MTTDPRDREWLTERDGLVAQAMDGKLVEDLELKEMPELLGNVLENNARDQGPELLLALKTLLNDPTATEQAWAAIEKAEL